jgi:DNA polymerase III subunit epsilon
VGTATAAAAHQPSFDQLGTPLIDVTFVVLDLETTGLSPGADRITEVGAVKVRGGEVIGELQTLVHPGRPIPPAVTAVTGITDAMVRDAPRIEAVLPTVLRFLGDAVLVAHNASFDVSFLRAAVEAQGGRPFQPTVVDTARLARRLVADEVRDRRLGTLARHFAQPHRPRPPSPARRPRHRRRAPRPDRARRRLRRHDPRGPA